MHQAVNNVFVAKPKIKITSHKYWMGISNEI